MTTTCRSTKASPPTRHGDAATSRRECSTHDKCEDGTAGFAAELETKAATSTSDRTCACPAGYECDGGDKENAMRRLFCRGGRRQVPLAAPTTRSAGTASQCTPCLPGSFTPAATRTRARRARSAPPLVVRRHLREEPVQKGHYSAEGKAECSKCGADNLYAPAKGQAEPVSSGRGFVHRWRRPEHAQDVLALPRRLVVRRHFEKNSQRATTRQRAG